MHFDVMCAVRLGFVQTKFLETYSFQSELFIDWKFCRQHGSEMFYTWSAQKLQFTSYRLLLLQRAGRFGTRFDWLIIPSIPIFSKSTFSFWSCVTMCIILWRNVILLNTINMHSTIKMLIYFYFSSTKVVCSVFLCFNVIICFLTNS